MTAVVYVSEHGLFVPRALDLSGVDVSNAFVVKPESLYTNFERTEFSWSRLKDIKACLDAGMYRMALLGALTVPDVCGRIEYPDIEKDSVRYAKWFDTYVGAYNIGHVGRCGNRFSCFNGYMCYLLRCRVVHGESENVEEIPNRPESWFMKAGYDRVIFKFTSGRQSEFYDIVSSDKNKHVAMFHIGIYQLVMQLISNGEGVFEKYVGKVEFDEPYSFIDVSR